MSPRAGLLIACCVALLTPLITSAQPRLPAGVRSIAFSPDGRLVAAGGGGDAYARVWDVASGREVGRFGEHTGVMAVAFSRDGRTLAIGTNEGAVILWAVATRKEKVRIASHDRGGVSELAYTPNGKLLVAAGGEDGTVAILDAATGDKLRGIPGRSSSEGRMALSPDGQVVATLGSRGRGFGPRVYEIRVFDLATGNERARLDTPGRTRHAIVFHPDGRLIVADSPEMFVKGELRVWDWAGTKTERVVASLPQSGSSVGISSDGKLIVSVGWDQRVRVWEFETGKLLGQFRLETSWRLSSGSPPMALSPDDKLVALGSGVMGRLFVHDVATGKDLHAEAAARAESRLRAYWTDLGRADPRKSAWAVKALASRPDDALAFITYRIPSISRTEIENSIAYLKRTDENLVESAEETLELSGKEAEPALRKALEAKPEPAVRARLERLLSRIPAGVDPTLQRVRAVAVLERIDRYYAVITLQVLAAEPTELPVRTAAQAALKRMRK